MQTYPLTAHPACPPLAVSSIEARIIAHDDSWLRLRWRIEGSQKLVVPPFAGKGRADDLWKTTCFEAFLQPSGEEAYVEINLSPSERWAVWDFSAPRVKAGDRPMPREPECTIRLGSSFAIFDGAIQAVGLPAGACSLGLTAVIEEQGGVLSYWALDHGKERPDFHDPACFTAVLEAPGRS